MNIQNQVKELQEHLNHFEAEKFRLFEEIRKIRTRQKEGKIYGNEAQELASLNKQLNNLTTTIGTKERQRLRLEKQVLSSTQTAFF